MAPSQEQLGAAEEAPDTHSTAQYATARHSAAQGCPAAQLLPAGQLRRTCQGLAISPQGSSQAASSHRTTPNENTSFEKCQRRS